MIDKFQALNRERIERLGSLLPVKHHSFLDFLPLLFQVNSTSLPGFINLETPAGIVDYQPNKPALDAAKKQHHTFDYRRKALRHYPIRALYLVNENGIYNYNAQQPFKLWLIYAPTLSDPQLTLLTQKAIAISTWAATQKITVEIQLFNETTLATDTISSFDLDRLYSGGLLLAGYAPNWWNEDLNGDSPEFSSRFAKDMLNFGALSKPSLQQCFDAVADRIDLAMTQGLESCLDLIYYDYLLEADASNYQLSPILKRIIMDGEADPMHCDLNTLKLTVITKKTADPVKINLAQQSLYMRSKELLSKKYRRRLIRGVENSSEISLRHGNGKIMQLMILITRCKHIIKIA